MTTEERLSISDPCIGRVIFDTDEGSIFIWDGEQWVETGSGGGGDTPQPVNGLEDISGDIGLGGTLIQNTTIDLDSYSFQTFSTAQTSGGYGLTQNLGEFGLFGPSGNTVSSIQFSTDGVDTAITVTDVGANGISYAADYSTNNATNPRWLADKGYVDYTVLNSPLTGYTIGTNAALNSSDTILTAFGKLQQQSNNRYSNNMVLSLFTVGPNSAVTNTDTVIQALGKFQGQINALKTQHAGGYEPFVADGVIDTVDITHGLNIDNGNAADPNRYRPSYFSLTSTEPITNNHLNRTVSFPDANTLRIHFSIAPNIGEDANYVWVVYK